MISLKLNKALLLILEMGALGNFLRWVFVRNRAISKPNIVHFWHVVAPVYTRRLSYAHLSDVL